MNWFYSLSKRWWKKSILIKMILLTSQLPYQQPNQLKPDTFNLSQEFLACVCSRRQSLRGRNLEDSRGEKRRGGLWLEASGGHTLLIINVWFSMQEVYATKSQIFRDVYCYWIHLTLLRSLKPKQHTWSWMTGKEREAEESCLRLNLTSLV